jgi:hypothetical protein
MNLVLFQLILVGLLIKKMLSMKECDEWSQKHIFNSTELHLSNWKFPFVKINSFEDMDVAFDNPCKKIEMKEQLVLKIFLNNKALLDNDLKINNILKFFSPIRMLLFQNVKGFNQRQFWKTKNHKGIKSETPFHGEYDFFNVNFDFYQNGTLITEENCKRENFDRNMKSFFGDIQNLMLNTDVFYNQKTCPYVFMNAKLLKIGLLEIVNSLVFMNRLEFLDINETDSFDFKTNLIESLEMNIVYETVSLKNLNKYVFKR